MATNLFSQAAKYRKKHPHLSQSEAVSLLSRKNKKKPAKKKAAVGKVRRKKAAKKRSTAKKAAPRKIKVKVKAGRKGGQVISIGAINLSKIRAEHEHQAAMHRAIKHHRAMKAGKGLSKSEKARIQREIDHYNSNIKASKQHITALKRGL
jgi:hypothetical protein